MKNYNTYTKQLRFTKYKILNPEETKLTTQYGYQTFLGFTQVDKNLYQLFPHNFIPKNYKPYWAFLSFWFLKSLIYKNPISRLDKQSKRHMTIVILMILTILISLIIAYYAGIFDKNV